VVLGSFMGSEWVWDRGVIRGEVRGIDEGKREGWGNLWGYCGVTVGGRWLCWEGFVEV
jgi:hypothetical protein